MNVFEFAYTAEANWKANLEDMTDWKPSYTFYSDFGIAEFCEVYSGDKGAIKDTYKNVIENWGGNYKALAEIVLVLNHKIWAYFGDKQTGVDAQYLGVSKDKGNEIAKVYNDLWTKAQDLFFKKYGKNEVAMDYYYRVTD